MRAYKGLQSAWLLSAWVVACGGGAPPAGEGAGADVPETVDSAQVQSLELVREVYTYRGTGRDPFRSLVESGEELRPFLEDLRVTSIIYDARYPARSVAVLRDTTRAERYEVRVDDEVGRLRVTEIREHEVVITVDDFGVPRQVVLSLRRRQGGNP